MDWKTDYERRLTSAEEAVRRIPDHSRIYIHHACSYPKALEDALAANYRQYTGVEISQMFTMSPAPCCAPECEGHFSYNSLYAGASTRAVLAEKRGDFTPCYFYRIPELYKKDILHVDAALLHMSAPDEHGFCSFGLNNDCSKAAAESADMVIAQLNPQMPYVYGDNMLHISKMDHIVEVNYPPAQLPAPPVTEVERRIGEYCAELVEDGSTLQLGIGGIPNAAATALKNKKHLGIHTEMFSDAVVELAEAGVIDGSRKTLHPGKIITSFLMGTERLYRFVHRNPMVEMHPVDYVNHPIVISKNHRMVSINSCVEIDFCGQVASESAGRRQVSGVGGQVDFVRGAALAGGTSIIAMTSTAMGGKVSRIVPTLPPGAYVTTNRHDVDYVVTEYGVARLFGKSVRQRAEALIAIAHPDFRGELRTAFREHFAA